MTDNILDTAQTIGGDVWDSIQALPNDARWFVYVMLGYVVFSFLYIVYKIVICVRCCCCKSSEGGGLANVTVIDR